MTSGELQIYIGLLLIMLVCYTAGRLHQWSRSGLDRESAYREGYDEATYSLFGLATRARQSIKSNTRELPAIAPPASQPQPPARTLLMPPPGQPLLRPRPRRGPKHAA